MRNLISWIFFGAMLLSCENKVPELNIVREEKVEEVSETPVVLTADEKWEKLENGLYRAEFKVPTTFLAGGVSVDDPPSGNPFAVPVTQPRKRTAKSILAGAGITFGKGSSATYEPLKSVVIVEQAEDQMELIDLFLNFELVCAEKGAHVRVEIYELSSEHVLQLMESTQSEGDHSPERNAALNAVRNGKGRLVASPSILCRSGQRSKVDGSEQVSFFLKPDEADEDVTAGGTTLEVDVVLGADEYTIDLNMQINHYTRPPSELVEKNSDDDRPLLLHRKTITTQATLKDGNYLLIGNWKPTGDPRFEKTDLGHVAFVTASFQRRENP